MHKMKKRVLCSLGIVFGIVLCAGLFIINREVGDRICKYFLYGILAFLTAGGILSFFYFRKRFIALSDTVCSYADEIVKGNLPKEALHQETLTSKMAMELEKIADIQRMRVQKAEAGKAEVQQLVSDIAHQLKTPMSNIRMYGDTLLRSEITREEEERFLSVMNQQIGKLEFLIDSLVKMSRLESNMIQLKEEDGSIFQTLALAIETIAGKAQKKMIDLHVECRETIHAVHDVKWTAEALGNLLDNAVKYTPERGCVTVRAFTGEMYVEVQIEDTGRGISPEHYNDVFKRFYREKGVEKTEGLGIGLYLSRQIISMQGGYIKVKSEPDQGSVFSVYLPIQAA